MHMVPLGRAPARPLFALALLTVSFFAPARAHAEEAESTTEKKKEEDIIVLEKFVAEEKANDPFGLLPNQATGSAVGFNRKIEDTPRSVSVVGSEMIDKVGIRDADQLFQVIPGTYTINRWGISGATQVRNNTSDTYIRGMKRIDPQGNIRNVITMWDSVEVVKGPPSPIYGTGRIGGYTNFVPKSVRGTTGKYLDHAEGSIGVTSGSFGRAEVQVNYAQPLQIGKRDAGFQVFALMNDSSSFYKQNYQKDRVLQASYSMNLNDRWRIEAGGIYQAVENSGMAGANRVDQYSLDHNLYLRGTPLVNLDFDGNGRVSEKEIQDSRYGPGGVPFAGSSTFNGIRPLSISFALPANGGFSVTPGVPANLKALLMLPQYAAAAASPAGQAILAAPTGGPLASGQQVPVGYFLNPALISYGPRDWSLTAIEERARGEADTMYFDIIDDSDPDRTQKLQLFFDHQNQDKRSQLPFNQDQNIAVFETKYTITRSGDSLPFASKLPSWATIDLLSSVNIRYSDGGGIATSGDYDHRRDLVTGYTPSDTFASFLVANDRSYATGEPISNSTFTQFTEYGGGVMADIKLWNRLSIMGGVRYDYTQARTVEGFRFDRTGATARNGGYLPRREAEGNDSASSATGSISYKLPWLGLTPYFTQARSSSSLAGQNQSLSYTQVIGGQMIGEGTLVEAGLKGSIPAWRVFYSVSAYDQVRSSSALDEGETFIRSTRNRGIEAEIRWAPTKHFSMALTGTSTKVLRTQLTTTRTAQATAEYVGFQSLKDASGNVIVPANAFTWGGNVQVIVPPTNFYREQGQYPDHILTLFLNHNWDSGFGVTWNTTYASKVAASLDLPDLLGLPAYYIHTASAYWQHKSWRISLIVRNVTDELYWVPNAGSAGGTLLQAGLPRNFELSVTKKF